MSARLACPARTNSSLQGNARPSTAILLTRLSAEVDQTTGRTIVTHRENVPPEPGLQVEVRAEDSDDAYFAKKTIQLAKLRA